MGVELIGDEDPLIVRRSSDCLRDMSNKVRLLAGCANAGSKLFSGCDLKVGSQALRAVANVFVFLSFVLACLTCHARLHRFCGRGALKRLDAGLFIGAHEMNALRMQFRGLFVEITHRFDLFAKFFRVSIRRIEPVFSPMRF